MGNQIKKNNGQALIELTLSFGLICVVVFLSGHAALMLRNKYKHDFMEPPVSVPDFSFKPSNGLTFFKPKEKSQYMKALEDSGWKQDGTIESDEGKIVVMSKDERKMVVTKDLGIML